MMKIIEGIRNQQVPINSPIAAAQYLGDSGIGKLEDKQYVAMIEELTGTTVSFDDTKMYRLTYGYLVTNAISASHNTDKIDEGIMLEKSIRQAQAIINAQPWLFVEDNKESLDENGNVKAKKGAKKELAMKVYKEDIEGKELTRKKAIEILVDKVNMTPAGASTYYANLKRNSGVL